MNSTVVLWAYIVLLVVGGLIGYFKAGSKVSLIMALVFAGALALCATGRLRIPYLTESLLLLLLAVFVLRFAKTRRFMPAGVMAVATLAAFALFRLF
jgi:uncharacterized membrane protein (UPF0136 family)